MERTISTALTPFWKFLFPAWIVAFLGAFTFAEIAHPERIHGGRTWQSVLGTIFSWLIASAVCFKLAQARRVRVTGEGLLVSNYLREILVPWSMITDVELEHGGRGSWYVNLTFREATPLGRRAMFIPKQEREAIVAEIRHHAVLDVESAPGVSVQAG